MKKLSCLMVFLMLPVLLMVGCSGSPSEAMESQLEEVETETMSVGNTIEPTIPQAIIYEPISPTNVTHVGQTLQALLPEGSNGPFKFTPDGSQIIILSVEQITRVETETFTITYNSWLPSWLPDSRIALAISPDGNLIAKDDVNTQIELMDLETGTESGRISLDYHLQAASFSPDGSLLAIVSNDDWRVDIWDIASLTRIQTLSGFLTPEGLYTATFSHNPDQIVYIIDQATAQVQDIHTGELSSAFLHDDFVTGFDLSRQGDLLAIITGASNNGELSPIIQLWDVASGESVGILNLNQPARWVVFSPDGSLIAVALGDEVQLWDTVNQTNLAAIPSGGEFLNGMVFSPDGRMLVTCSVDEEGQEILTAWQAVP